MKYLFKNQKKGIAAFVFLLCFCALRISAQTTLVGWNMASQAGFGTNSLTPTTLASNLTMVNPLTRGSGVGQSGTPPGSGCWGGGGTGWSGVDAGSIIFSFSVQPGYQVSLSSISSLLRRSSTGPSSANVDYSLNGGTSYVTLGSWTSYATSGTAGAANSTNLSGVTALQNIQSGTNIRFRISFPGASGGNWYFTGTPGSLVLSGALSVALPAFSASITATPISCNSFTDGALSTTVSGGTAPYTYSWAPTGATTSAISNLPPGVYTCTVVGSGTLETAVATYTLVDPPVLTGSVVSQNDASCFGASNGSATVTGVGGSSPYTYSWTPAVGSSSAVISLPADTYTVNITDSHGCTGSQTLSIAQPTTVMSATVAQNDATCNGGSGSAVVTAVAGGNPAYTYSWAPSGGNAAIATGLHAGDYTVTIKDASLCTTTQTLTITEPSTMAVISASSTSSAVCVGGTVAVSGMGATTYTWSDGLSDGVAFTPSMTATYSVVGTMTDGCNGSANITVSINPTPTITVNSGVVCPGGIFTLTPGGAATYTISGGSNTVAPTGLTTYTIDGTSAQGCPALASAIATVDVSNTLSVSITSPSAICLGQSATLTANGASSYTWSNGSTDYTLAISPTVAASYTVDGASGTCSNTAVINIGINTPPVVSVTGGTVTCAGSSVSLTASGADTYSWSNGGATATIAPSPTINTVYTAVGTDSNNCSSSASLAVTVNPVPTITIPNGTVCLGSSFTLNPSGASTYTFSSGSAVVSPTSNTTYSVTGTSTLGCVSATAAVATLTVSQLPVVAVNSGTICSGRVFTMTPSGAFTYTFSGGSNTVAPASNTSYSVTGTNSVGCVSASAAIASIVVNASPTITVNSASICAGQVFTMIPSGASTYTFSNGSATVSPTVTASYSVNGTNTLGCVSPSAAIVNVTVFAVPSITVSGGSVCTGDSFTLNPAGAASFTFSGGSAVVTPTSTTSYSVAGTTTAGCVSPGSVVATVSVFALPTISLNNGTVCAGDSYTLNPSGAYTYTFSNGSAVITPTGNATYSVTGTSSIGCAAQNTAVATISVIAIPVLSVTSASAVCLGSSGTLSVSGADTYSWSTGSHSANIVITPTATAVYSVTGTATTGCVGAAFMQTITVNPVPTISISNATVCPGESYTLAPSGAATYSYALSGPVISPTVTTSFSVTGTSSLGCTSPTMAVAVITVSNGVVVTVSGTTLVCSGMPAAITASGAATYSWSNGATTSSAAPTPTANTTYTVFGNVGTCGDTAMIVVHVNPSPTISIVSNNNNVICAGEAVTFISGGATTYTWTNGVTSGTAFTPTATATYTVMGTDANGCVGMASITQDVNACTGINAIAVEAQQLLVYPNPNNGSFTIKTTSAAHLVLINELGQVLQTIDQNSNESEVTGLTPGIYFLTGSDNGFAVKQKIVVTR